MVKTRHSAGADDLTYGEFITLPTSGHRGNDDFQGQVNGYQEDGDSEEMEEEVLPNTRTRGKVNLTIFEGSTTEDEAHVKDTRRKRFHSSSGAREEPIRSSGRCLRRSRPITNRHHRVEEQVVISEIRRSGRQRKVTYDTLNQGLINKQLSYLSASEMNGYCDHHDDDNPRKKRREELEEAPQDEEMVDMYTRVKRDRPRIKRDMYGVPVKDDEQGGDSTNEDDEESEEEETEEEAQNSRSYYLREQRQRTQIYEAPIEPKKNRPRNIFRESTPPPSRPRRHTVTYRSPARRQTVRRRRKAAFHGSSSTSSSSAAESEDDERRFERRKAKSMTKSRQRCLPMNLNQDDIATGFIRDRVKIGSSLADVDPMNIDRAVTFESVGGLGKHVRSLKEMVVFPLLYPEVFEKFSVTPPRGVLFHGPPGTGKTLVARALANECSSGERKVAFFMRKGADCLSKWVGESERQLRLLFDQAYQMRPAIIFFDEIDGLAPVRSSRQDQIHSSIVSTLLALMDGLDNRGEIVVIGATNRIDSIDPALRRPGRFDREFLFPLPSLQARAQILQIHTNPWNPKLSAVFLQELAEKCVGYCGADLRALCTEAALQALRRRYPQIYNSQDKLQLDVNSILVNAQDFHRAMQVIVPTAQRSVATPARALSHSIQPLLRNMMNKALCALKAIFPPSLSQLSSVDVPAVEGATGEEDEFCSDVEDGPDIYEHNSKGKGRKKLELTNVGSFLDFTRMAHRPTSHRPRLLLAGGQGQGQSTYLAPGILHSLERMPVKTMDLPALYAVSSSTPEESCANIFREAKRTCPSIIYVPHIDHWWEVIGDTLRATFLTMLRDLEPSSPILFLATSDEEISAMPLTLRHLFDAAAGEVIEMLDPSNSERREYFEELLLKLAIKPPPTHKQAAQIALEVLPRAAPTEPKPLTDTELKRVQEQEEVTMRELRLFLREVLTKLGRDRKFTIFAKPVDEEEVPDYYQIISNPMDLSTMMKKIDLHQYQTVKEFMSDVELIVSNALEYNPETDPADRAIRHRACSLKDTAQAILVAELDEEFEKLCEEIKEAKARRGEKSNASVPSYYFTKPLGRGRQSLLKSTEPIDNGQSSTQNSHIPPNSNNYNDQDDDEIILPKVRSIVKRIQIPRSNKKYQSPWCKPSKRQYRKIIVYLDEDGNEIGQEGGNIRTSRKRDPEDKEEIEQKEDESATMEEIVKQEVVEQDKDTKELGHPANPVEDGASVNDETDSKASTLEVETASADVSPHQRTISPKRQNTSPRGRTQSSPRTSRSPRKDNKSPVSSHGSVDRSGKSPKTQRDAMQDEATPRSSSSGVNVPKRLSTSDTVAMETSATADMVDCERENMEEGKHSPTKTSPSKIHNSEEAEEIVVDEKNETDAEENKSASPQMRVTRSQMHPAQRQKAMEILEEQTRQVTVDQERVSTLLEKTVRLTHGCNTEQLEKLYSMMCHCIYQHRKDFDKNILIQDLEKALIEFTSYRR